MTLLFADSFDHYTTMPNVKGWTQTVQAPGPGAIGAFGRNGTNGYRVVPSQGVWQVVPGSPASLVMGCAMRTSGLPGDWTVLAFWDSGTIQVDVRVSVLGALKITRNGTVLATSAVGLIVPNQYNYLEMKATIDPAAGSVTVKLNGNVAVSVAGVNTRATGVSQITHASLVGTATGSGGQNVDIDDVYICNTAGVRNNDFLGDVRVQAVLPTGVGNYTQWDGVTGAATHWQAQNQNPPDDDATYASDSLAVAGHLDSYAMGDVTPTSGTVAAVQVSAWARKDDAGVRTLATMVRSAAVDAVGASVNIVNTYAYLTQVYETDPGGAAWTIASVNGAEAGVKAVA